MFKKTIVLVCMAATLLLLAVPAFAAGKGIELDFSKDNINDWRLNRSDFWVIEADGDRNYLKQTDYDWNAAIFGDGKNDDFTFETTVKSMDFKPDDWAAQMYFRFRTAPTDNFNGYAFVINNSYLKLVRGVEGKETVLGSKEFKPKGTEEYQVKIVAKGPKIEVYFNGESLFSVKDDTFKAGEFGFATWNCKVSIGNIHIAAGAKGAAATKDTTTSPEAAKAEPSPTAAAGTDAEQPVNPKTGDAGVGLYAVLAAVSIGFIVWASKRSKQPNHN